MSEIPIEAVTTKAQESAPDLIRPPGVYFITFFGKTYKIKAGKTGLVRLVAYPEARQFIIWDRSEPQATLKLCCLLALLLKHGIQDNILSFKDKMTQVQQRHLLMNCGYTALFVKEILKQHGIRSRIVTSLRKNNINSYDNGHTILEVLINGRWMLVDFNTKNLFLNQQKTKYLNALEYWEQLPNIHYEKLTYMHSSYAGDATGAFLIEKKCSSKKEREKDFQTMFGYIAIESNGGYLFFCEDKKYAQRIRAYSKTYKTANRELFIKTFYSH